MTDKHLVQNLNPGTDKRDAKYQTINDHRLEKLFGKDMNNKDLKEIRERRAKAPPGSARA